MLNPLNFRTIFFINLEVSTLRVRPSFSSMLVRPLELPTWQSGESQEVPDVTTDGCMEGRKDRSEGWNSDVDFNSSGFH